MEEAIPAVVGLEPAPGAQPGQLLLSPACAADALEVWFKAILLLLSQADEDN